jgi:hypothetical protein
MDANTTPRQRISAEPCSCSVCNALDNADELLRKEMAKLESSSGESYTQVITDVDHLSGSTIKSVCATKDKVPSMSPSSIEGYGDEDPLAAAFFRDQTRKSKKFEPSKLLPIGEWAKIYKSAGITISARAENSQWVGYKRQREQQTAEIIAGEEIKINNLAESLQREFESTLSARKL